MGNPKGGLPMFGNEFPAVANVINAKKLLLDLLAVIPDGEKAAAFFAEDGVMEIPFLHAIGIPTRYQGHAAIKEFFNFAWRNVVSRFRLQAG